MNGRPTATTTADWLPVAAQIGADINERMAPYQPTSKQRRAVRELSVHIGPQPNAPAPAWWDHTRAEVCLDSRVALPNTRPADVNYADPAWRAEHLRAVGLVEHEVGHVIHTPKNVLAGWDKAGGTPLRLFGQYLEETRMEAQTIHTGGDATALRAVANELILRDFDAAAAIGSPRFGNAMRMVGILGRSDKHGGSIPDAELRDYRKVFSDLLGADTVAALEHELHDWNGTSLADFPHGERLFPMLRRWMQIVGDDPDNDTDDGDQAEGEGEGEGEGQEGQPNGEPQDGDQDGDQSGEASDQAKPAESRENAAQAPQPGESADRERQEQAAEQIAERLIERLDDAARAARQAARTKAAKAEQVDRQTLDESVKGHGVSPDSGHATVQLEPVTPEVRRLATQLARDFRKIATPQIKRTTQTSMMPPGRLRGRGAAQRAAQADAGLIPTAHPFRTTKRKRTHAPPPGIGIILDVSGSMDSARRPVAHVGYALAEAGRAVQAKTCMVAMGSIAQPMTHDPSHVSIYDGVGGSEDFRTAFGIVDTRLRLTDHTNTGTRLLVIVSDGHYGLPGALPTAEAAERDLPRRGCGVLWIAPTGLLRINARHVYKGADAPGIIQAVERALASVRGGSA